MVDPETPTMTSNVEAAHWILDRLSPWDSRTATSVIPGGFEAYARNPHPVQLPDSHHALVRWSDVSRWSKVPLHSRVQWHELALPDVIPEEDPPWDGQGPRRGSLFIDDALALIEDLVPFTATPNDCFFCLWNGYSSSSAMFVKAGSPRVDLPPRPQPPRLVELPHREYGLVEAPLSDATFLELTKWLNQSSPSLWWPADQSWCVASEIDFAWTYVGGSFELIKSLLADECLEVIEASPDDPRWIDLSGWLLDLIEHAADEVLLNGSATMTLIGGTIGVSWEQLDRRGRGVITTRMEYKSGRGSSNTPTKTRDPVELRQQIVQNIHGTVLNVIGAL
jgi:hypothetical protein